MVLKIFDFIKSLIQSLETVFILKENKNYEPSSSKVTSYGCYFFFFLSAGKKKHCRNFSAKQQKQFFSFRKFFKCHQRKERLYIRSLLTIEIHH